MSADVVCRWCGVELIVEPGEADGEPEWVSRSRHDIVCLRDDGRPMVPLRAHEPVPSLDRVMVERCQPGEWVLVPMRVVRVIPADESFPVVTVTLQTCRWDGDTLIAADADLCDAVWLETAPAGHVPPPPPIEAPAPVERPVDLFLGDGP